jgi:cell division protein FtsN
MKSNASSRRQWGRFIPGLIVGVLIGLALALMVAVYVNKVPLPFVDKMPQGSAAQDAVDSASNKQWDPNAPLAGANPARPKPVEVPVVTEATASAPPAAAASGAEVETAATPASPTNPATPDAPPATTVSTKSPASALNVYVQAGAYSVLTEAEQQRAKVAMLGLQASISEREVHGRTMYRVRLGPFASEDEAAASRLTLAGGNIESALVRVQP